jgi:hypothetical protein
VTGIGRKNTVEVPQGAGWKSQDGGREELGERELLMPWQLSQTLLTGHLLYAISTRESHKTISCKIYLCISPTFNTHPLHPNSKLPQTLASVYLEKGRKG